MLLIAMSGSRLSAEIPGAVSHFRVVPLADPFNAAKFLSFDDLVGGDFERDWDRGPQVLWRFWR